MIFSTDTEINLWHCIEKLGLHCFGVDEFKKMVNEECLVVFPDNLYPQYPETFNLSNYIKLRGDKFFNLVSDQNLHSRANVIEKFYFNPEVRNTESNLFKYGDYEIKIWYPQLKESLSGQKEYVVDENRQRIGVKMQPGKKLLIIKFNNFFLQNITDEINNCYSNRFFLSSTILCRKLLETIVFHVLKVIYPRSPEFWKNKIGNPVRFQKLLENFHNARQVLHSSESSRIGEIYDDLVIFKGRADKAAHSETGISNTKTFEDPNIQVLIFRLTKFYTDLTKGREL